MIALLAAIEFIDMERLPEFLVGLAFNSLAISSIAILTYRRAQSRATYVFTLVVVNIVVFFVTYLMSSAAISTNVGFGLFALFGILRFRTGTLPVIEMTYLFAGIALASFNALALTSLTLAEAVIANVVIVGLLELLGGKWLSSQPQVHSLIYERIELVHPGRRRELIADLENRTGLIIAGVEVGQINFLNDTAKISIRVLPTTTSDLEPRTFAHASDEQYEQYES
ncbi:MAG: DUF4956 domain-containing protein [Actinobacteria bacterium]|nr:DUF4956 domain-containing protein [Actinomycetota bacterium]